MTATTLPGARIAALDIVRGVAVMGILAMNIVAFAMPFEAYMNPRAYGGAEGADLAAWAAGFILFDGKMRGLFSLLFGASLLIVVESAEATAPGSSGALHFRRMASLLLFGLLHLYLVWFGDILTLYALVGMAAYFLCDRPVRDLLRYAFVCIGVQWLLMGALGFGLTAARNAASAPGASAEAVGQWQAMSAPFSPLPPQELADTLALYRGGYGEIVAHRLAEDLTTPIHQLMLTGFETLGYMLLGMAALKSGLLAGHWPPRSYRRLALGALGLTIPLYGLLASLIHRSGFEVATLFNLAMVATVPIRPLMIIGYAALILWLARPGGSLTERIAAAGRAAFTNYIGTSLVATSLFYGYGAGLYGRLGRAELYAVVLALSALMLLWSKPWLARYRYGPIEWLWRSLARGALQPMRLASARP